LRAAEEETVATSFDRWCFLLVDESGKKSGNKLNDILLIVVATMWIGLVAAFFIPNYIGGGRSPRAACIANLRSIEGAKGTWALENHKSSNAIPTDADLFGQTNYIREKPICPAGGVYTLGSIAEKPRCSISGHTI
jgi:hypothetical protein